MLFGHLTRGLDHWFLGLLTLGLGFLLGLCPVVTSVFDLRGILVGFYYFLFLFDGDTIIEDNVIEILQVYFLTHFLLVFLLALLLDLYTFGVGYFLGCIELLGFLMDGLHFLIFSG